MITISLINMKGGVGKTTLAVNLAHTMYRRRKARILLVDLDPQFNASQYLMSYDLWAKHKASSGTIADLLDASRGAARKKKGGRLPQVLSYLHRVEGSADEEGYLHLLPSELGLSKCIKNPQGVEFRLQKALDDIADYFDYVFIDSAPTDTVLTATALMASDYVLVPMKPDRFSILGRELIETVLADFKADYPDPRKVKNLGVVFTFVSKKPNAIEKECKATVANAASYVFKAEVAVSGSYLRSVHEQSPISDTRYAHQATKGSMNALEDELETRIKEVMALPKGRKHA